MCRLYGFRSTVPRRVECELIGAQNALIRQSLRDERGESNPDGWGLGFYVRAEPCVEREVSPAYESAEFRREAAMIHSRGVLAHVRRATVGHVCLENTHPFRSDAWLLAHNGTIGGFGEVRPRMLEAMTPVHRAAIGGDTDSEHLLHFLESLAEARKNGSRLEVLRDGLRQVRDWAAEAAPEEETALNVLWAGPAETIGSRLGRTLFCVAREEVHACEVCEGAVHVHEDRGGAYRAVVIASEPITRTEEWTPIPDGSVFRVGAAADLTLESL